MSNNVRYNLSVDWIAVEESIVLHQLDVVEQQLADINDQDTGGYIRVYIRGNAAPEADADEVARPTTSDPRLDTDPSFSSNESLGLRNAARFDFITTSDENLLNDSQEVDADPAVISVFSSLSREDLSQANHPRTTSNSIRAGRPRSGLHASTSRADAQRGSPETGNDQETIDDDGVNITVRSSNSNERIEASHKGMQAGKSIGNLSGWSPSNSAERLPVTRMYSDYAGGEISRSSSGDKFSVDKVTRSSSTDALTAAGSLQVYDSTGTFRIPSSPKSRKSKTPENKERNEVRHLDDSGDSEAVSGSTTRHETRSLFRNSDRRASGASTSGGRESSSKSVPVKSAASDGSDRDKRLELKRKVYNLRSMSTKTKMKKRLPMPN